MVLMSAWMPAPPDESDPAMTSTRPFIRRLSSGEQGATCRGGPSTQARGRPPWAHAVRPYGARGWCLGVKASKSVRRGGGRDPLDGAAHFLDDGAHQLGIVALGHHADDRLGAGGADHKPSAIAEPSLAA